jgi:AbiV family abortive infection protein
LARLLITSSSLARALEGNPHPAMERIKLPPSVAWIYALTALTNSNRLAKAAHALFELEHFGPATSLAISSREEVGKFFRLLHLAFELPSRNALNLHDHKQKQAIGLALAFLPRLTDLGGVNSSRNLRKQPGENSTMVDVLPNER